ncbi:DoxX family protein [Microbulbifer taiwanensis]|uniref:DoxX family protein n=1 Tax=Microbulbifer taiwanensis TaxID=986746 RepID=UPI00361D6430
MVIAFLVFDGAIKLAPIQPVTDSLLELGFTPTDALARGLGILLIACTLLYAIPRTSLLGAILVTGYLGGAIAIQVRVGNPLFTHILFSFYLGAFMWAGLLIRNRQARYALFSEQRQT